ncbi:MAG: ABC transporter permease [Candidatus Zixiibacteriota bacterium]
MLYSSFKIALAALWAHKLRSGLTVLGVLVGVMSVMTIISALEGIMGVFEDRLSTLGPRTVIVSRIGTAMSHEEFEVKRKRKPLDMKSIPALEKGCEHCDRVTMRAFESAELKYRDQKMRDVVVAGSEYSYVDIVDITVVQGRFHSFEDDLYHRPVVFIGDLVREEFFSGVDPVGKELRIGGSPYTVIGVAKKLGSMFGESQDGFVVIPMTAFIKQFGEPRQRIQYVFQARSIETLGLAMDEIRGVMRARRHVPFDKPDDFDMLTASSILETINNFTRIFRMGIIGISSISLVVGGIVVMNIMMVSVTERTREIGIRKAVGARHGHILTQFIFESLTTTLVGGIIGIIIGFLLAKMLVGYIDMEIKPSMFAIFSGLIVSTGTGLIFGIYPAMKAARLDPVKALSYE